MRVCGNVELHGLSGNRRFLPVLCDGEQAECHILDNEEASRAYIDQVWTEAMMIYCSGEYSMKFSKAIREQLVKKQRDFMPEVSGYYGYHEEMDGPTYGLEHDSRPAHRILQSTATAHEQPTLRYSWLLYPRHRFVAWY